MRAREVLAANLRKLMAAARGLSRLPDLVQESGGVLSNGTLDRVRRATNATNIDTVEELAKVFDVEPWQLLVPTLQAEPAEASAKEVVNLSGMPGWPFKRIPLARVLALSPEDVSYVEGALANALDDLRTSPTPEEQKAFDDAYDRGPNPALARRRS